MDYTIDQLEVDIVRVNQSLSEIRLDRGVRYSTGESTLANVKDCDWFEKDGWRGALTSAIECMNRLKVMARKKTGDIDIKDFENATDDLINYAYFIKVLGRLKRVSLGTPCENGDCGEGDNPNNGLPPGEGYRSPKKGIKPFEPSQRQSD